MSNDPAANLAKMHSYLDDSRDALGPGHVIVDEMMLSDWCSALARAIGEADGSTLAGQQDAIALLRADIERLKTELDEALGWETVAKCNQQTAQSWMARATAAETDDAALIKLVARKVEIGDREGATWVGTALAVLAAQAAEIERLTRERDEAEATAGRLGKQMLDERRAKLAAEAERDALREALTDLAEEVEEYELGNPDTLRRARTALGGQP